MQIRREVENMTLDNVTTNDVVALSGKQLNLLSEVKFFKKVSAQITGVGFGTKHTSLKSPIT